MQTRTELLNYLIERYGLKSYVEIGLQNAANNFDKVDCFIKISVDPDLNAHAQFECSSDDFFKNNSASFDLFLIDGLHTAEQVQRDFENSLRCLNEKGFIVLHDCLPTEERFATHDRNTKQWYGTVWQFAATLNQYAGIDFLTVDMDCGCCIIRKSNNSAIGRKFEITWQNFIKNKEKMLNLISVNDFLNEW